MNEIVDFLKDKLYVSHQVEDNKIIIRHSDLEKHLFVEIEKMAEDSYSIFVGSYKDNWKLFISLLEVKQYLIGFYQKNKVQFKCLNSINFIRGKK